MAKQLPEKLRICFNHYFKQFTEGCGNCACKNTDYCATAGTALQKANAVLKTISLVKTGVGEKFFCKNVNAALAADTTSEETVAMPVAISAPSISGATTSPEDSTKSTASTPSPTTTPITTLLSGSETTSDEASVAMANTSATPSTSNAPPSSKTPTNPTECTSIPATSTKESVDNMGKDNVTKISGSVVGSVAKEDVVISPRPCKDRSENIDNYSNGNTKDIDESNEATETQCLTLAQVEECLDVASTLSAMDEMSDEDVYAAFSETIDEAFGTVFGASNSFLVAEGVPATPQSPGIKMDNLYKAIELISRTPFVEKSMSKAASTMINNIETGSTKFSIQNLRALVLVGALSCCDILIVDAGIRPNGITYGFCEAIHSLSKKHKDILSSWWASCLEAIALQKLIAAIQQFLCILVYTIEAPQNEVYQKLIPACATLKVIHQAWGKSDPAEKSRTSFELFYNDAINFDINLNADFQNWRRDKPCLCNYKFLLTAASKAHILHLDAMEQMHRAGMEGLQSSLQEAFTGGRRSRRSPYLILEVDRANVVEDTLAQVDQLRDSDLKKALKVKFKNEDGVDEGGLSKEFFQIIIAELFDKKYAMFTTSADERCYWFNGKTFEINVKFELIGVLMGIAIFNRIILDLHFPMIAYGKLLGKKPTLESLAEYMPEVANSLAQMLKISDEELEDMEIRMEWSVELYGGKVTEALVPGGEDIAVTQKNVQEYVDLVVDFILTKSMQPQFDAFKKGFLRVCQEGPLKVRLLWHEEYIELFAPQELERAICGSREMNFEELQANTRYDDGYYESHRVIRDFWSVFHNLTLVEKKKLLMFATGSDRAPVDGLKSLKLTIVRL